MLTLILVAWGTIQADTTPPVNTLPATAKAPVGIVVTVDRDHYTLGDTAQVTIGNHTERALLFALRCDGSMEGRRGEGWETTFEPDCSRIRVRPTRLDPGTRVVQPFHVIPCPPDTLPRYAAFRLRVRLQVAETGADRVVHSPPFTVSAE